MEFLAGLAALFVFGSLWFWIAFGVLCVTIIFFDESDSPIMAGIALLGFLWLMNASGLISFGSWSVLGFIASIIGYLIIGAAWSFAKWFFFLLRIKERLSDLRQSFVLGKTDVSIKRMNISPNIEDTMPPDARHAFRTYLWEKGYWSRDGWSSTEDNNKRPIIPTAAEHKQRIVRWMCFWPWSAAWTLLNDPLRRMFNAMFNWMRTTYERVANKVFGNISDDM